MQPPVETGAGDVTLVIIQKVAHIWHHVVALPDACIAPYTRNARCTQQSARRSHPDRLIKIVTGN